MKMIEQLELKMEKPIARERRIVSSESSGMLTDARWWFEQMKKAVDAAPEPTRQVNGNMVKPCSTRYRVVW